MIRTTVMLSSETHERLRRLSSDPPLPEDVDHFRRLAEKRAREQSQGC
jgi:hypothetical protein